MEDTAPRSAPVGDADSDPSNRARCLDGLRASQHLLRVIESSARLLESPFVGDKHRLVERITESARSMNRHIENLLRLLGSE